MPGTKIPVLETEKLTFRGAGRGLYITDDAVNFDVSSWAGTSGGALECTTKFLPAPSALAWWKVTSDAGTGYFIPLFQAVI